MKKINIILSLFLVFFLCGCFENVDSDNNDKESGLFSLDNKIEISLNIDESELLLIESDYQKYSSNGSKSPIYRYCKSVDIIIDEDKTTVEHVGIRMKGNTSRKSFYSKQDKFISLVHFKLSFDEAFENQKDINGENYYNKEYLTTAQKASVNKRTVFGLSSLELRWNKNYDKTLVREIYATNLFNHYGVHAAQMNLCNLRVNKEQSLGVFTLSEPIDKSFLKRSFNNSDYDLYKCAYKADFQGYNDNILGVEDENKKYFPTYDLKTNKKTSNHSDMKSFISALRKENFSSMLDIDHYINFMAIYYLLGDPDSILYNYNNFYVYFYQNKAYFIPYDFDRTIGIKKDWNPSGDALLSTSPSNMLDAEGNENSSLLLKNTIFKSGSEYETKYKQRISEMKNDDYFSFQEFEKLFLKAKTIYSDLVKPSYSNISGNYSAFSINESSSSSGIQDNLSVRLYFESKKK